MDAPGGGLHRFEASFIDAGKCAFTELQRTWGSFLAAELQTRLKAGPVKLRLVVQLPNPGAESAAVPTSMARLRVCVCRVRILLCEDEDEVRATYCRCGWPPKSQFNSPESWRNLSSRQVMSVCVRPSPRGNVHSCIVEACTVGKVRLM
jgi:hypothetical protein